MPSFYIMARARKDAGGYTSLRLCVTHDYKRSYVPLNIKVLASKWNADRGRVSRSHPDASRINTYLQQVKAEAQSTLTRLETRGEVITAKRAAEAIRARLSDEEQQELDFLSYARTVLEDYNRRGQHGTYKSYRSVLRKFEAFVEDETSRKELPFSALSAQLMRRFETWMYEVRGNKTNTVNKGMSIIRTFCNHAIRDGMMEQADYPFFQIQLESEPVQKEKLTPEEMERVLDLGEELEEGTRIWEVWTWFAFAFYAGGMRFSDVAQLRWKHLEGGRVQYKMQKTSEGAGVPIVEPAQEILDHYAHRDSDPEAFVFPILDGHEPGTQEAFNQRSRMNALANKYLKQIAARADVDKPLSFHISRHQIAWHMYKKLGDVYKVKQVLGHSSIRVTEEYLRGFEDDSLDDDYESLF